ncbi:hypothetical protein BN12_40047 [Nostocoides japonicum T1-X7]|uniref:Uncharacterized protein n=1 Tax=Nostocoides japonicum T1-X7 TaxID=1194083 RepID=A0A077M1Y9_9MICO|nr:hypothetical protein [Tetrasphaera japonica]CCH79077.1 hypothetical protein BN12_40047 [Tetrasphaera japonica T1-X7]
MTGEHQWRAAVTVPVSERQARLGLIRGRLHLPERQTVSVEDVYCASCRRPFDDVADEPCVVGRHLHGGPIGTRKNRKGWRA